MILEMFSTVACPQFVAPLGIVDAPRDIGKKLLALRDAHGKPVCAVVDDVKTAKRAQPLHLCDAESGTWGLEEGDE